MRTDLGKRLVALRESAIAQGMKLVDEEEIIEGKTKEIIAKEIIEKEIVAN